METEELADPQGSQVLVKMLACTLNPSDVNTVRTLSLSPVVAECFAQSRESNALHDPSLGISFHQFL